MTGFRCLTWGPLPLKCFLSSRGIRKSLLPIAVIHSGEPVGTIFKLPASAIQAEINNDPMVFLHSLKWDQALSYAKKIMQDEFPEDIQVYLIAVENIRLEVELSPEVKAAGEKVTALILEELKKINS